MLSIVRTVGLLALLCPSALSAAIPSLAVPWKRDGIFSEYHENEARDSSCSNGPKSRGCWDGGFSISTDMDQQWPNTGRTVTYNWEITNTTMAPDGSERQVLVVNGQYPGPALVANWGDDVVINVKNSLQNNGTGIHWHGIRQLGTNQMDGTPGITECPIGPGETRTYKWKATQFGSSWYHSHYSIQYGDGILGPIIIKGPATADYDIDLGAMPITDWFHTPSFRLNAQSLHASSAPTADTMLINGTMVGANGGGKYSLTTLQPGKKHLVRFINTGINNFVHVGLDGHKMTVIAADMVPIVPYTTESLAIAVGQRYDVIITADQPVSNYWLRVGTGGGKCDGPNANAANIRGIFSYDGAKPGNPTNSTGIVLPTGCDDETNLVPYVKTTVPANYPEKLSMSVSINAAQNNLVQWAINGSSLLINWEEPTLAYVADGNTTYPERDNIYTVGTKDSWQYWVIQSIAGGPPLPHPIHLHGHDFYVLASGAGNWTGDLSLLKTDNPVRRDTASLPANGFLVLAFESDNPGAWLMHCHIPFHVGAGFGLQFLERADDIQSSLGDLSGLRDECKVWSSYENSFRDYSQGDSGL